MEIGVFQLLPRPEERSDREVIAQAFWEVEFAERVGFESIWVAEHHLSPFGMIGAPSVWLAAIARMTSRIRIGYAVAVVPLHQPLRLAEEISWVDHLSEGRVLVGVGPGFSAHEFGAFGIPLEERHTRFEEGLASMRRILAGEELVPRPYTRPHPPILRAVSSVDSMRRAANDGSPVMLGLKSMSALAERLDAYRVARRALGVDDGSIEREIAEMRVLRRVSIAETDSAAVNAVRAPLLWEHRMAMRVHGEADARADDILEAGLAGALCGSSATVGGQLEDLHALGIRKIIGWLHFGDMPYANVRRSMELMAELTSPSSARARDRADRAAASTR